MKTTLDGLLNRRVALEQPTEGYRVAIDTVLLAAAVQANANNQILDFGCGAGGVMLCLMQRVPGISLSGMEIQPELVELCKKNIKSNGFEDKASIIQQDVTRLPDNYLNRFDHVVMNPPYHDETRHDVSDHSGKRMANSEKGGDLPKWIDTAAKALKKFGTLTIIHRADRMDDILHCLEGYFGDIDILPILPKESTTAKRVIIRAIKEEKKGTYFCQSFVLHKPDGAYSDEAEDILRYMKPLLFTRI